MSPYCYPCERYFPNHHARNAHLLNANAHMYDTFVECNVCVKKFFNQGDCNRHMDKHDHHGYECDTCDIIYANWDDCEEHMYNEGHWAHWCNDCSRKFDNANNLKMHLNSRVHRPNGISCPFCKGNFTTASGLSHHLETGSCASAPNLNRNTIHQIIRERDPNGSITMKQIGWHSEPTYEVTERSYNNYTGEYECYLCHRGFNSLYALSNHLNCGPHRSKIYHCPNRNCGKEFVAMAGLLNHLESESCQYTRFQNVQKQVGGIFTSKRMIRF